MYIWEVATWEIDTLKNDPDLHEQAYSQTRKRKCLH